MKKFFAVVAFAIAMICSVATTADAQTASVDPQVAYDQCHEYVVMGDNSYNVGEFAKAQTYYEEAIKCNMNCPDRKFMSDRKLNKKLENCAYALTHNGKTIEQTKAENSEKVAETIGTVLAVGAIAGVIASAAGSHSAPHHPVPHHDYHYGHDYHYDYYHHHHHF